MANEDVLFIEHLAKSKTSTFYEMSKIFHLWYDPLNSDNQISYALKVTPKMFPTQSFGYNIQPYKNGYFKAVVSFLNALNRLYSQNDLY